MQEQAPAQLSLGTEGPLRPHQGSPLAFPGTGRQQNRGFHRAGAMDGVNSCQYPKKSHFQHFCVQRSDLQPSPLVLHSDSQELWDPKSHPFPWECSDMTHDFLFFKLTQPNAIPLFLSWPFLSAALLHHQNHLHG